jgi:hypothetical protein
MSPSRLPQVPPPALPPLVAAYVQATNSFDLDGLLATFADDALVNDQLRDYWGKPAIREWAARDIIGLCCVFYFRPDCTVLALIMLRKAAFSAILRCWVKPVRPVFPAKD